MGKSIRANIVGTDHGPASAGFTCSNVHQVCEACSAILSVLLTKGLEPRDITGGISNRLSQVDKAVGLLWLAWRELICGTRVVGREDKADLPHRPFLFYRKIKTWFMEMCALKTSSWPVRALTVTLAHSSSLVTLASQSLC